MESKQKLMLYLGLILILSGLLFGLWFTYSVDHNTNITTKDSYEEVFLMLAEKNPQWEPLVDKINLQSEINRRAIDTHTHSINMGLLAILIALLYPFFRGSKLPLSIGFVLAAWIYPIGMAMQMLQWKFAGEIVAALGAGAAVVIFAIIFWRVKNNIDALAEENG